MGQGLLYFGQKAVRLVAIDLDGTLLDDEKQLAPRNVEVIRSLCDKGLRVTLSSGRLRSSMLEFASRLGTECPLICLNGSLIESTSGEQLYHGFLRRAMVKTLLAESSKLPPRPFLFTGNEISHLSVDREHMHIFDSWTGGRFYRQVENFLEEEDPEVLQVHWIGDEESIADLEYRVQVWTDGGVTTFRYPSARWDFWHLEVRKIGDDKGRGVVRLAHHLGIDPQEVMAIGDWWNDMPMFDVVGTSVAMSSGIREIRQRADFVTERSNNQAGVAHFLSRQGRWVS
ncbi:MAG: Cof-type HAD-IIB family hydrolase [Planctomycetota bacterium]|nr:Cof-type HAD-IIB family hydrolase [Planctomycetota bacterium]